MLSHRLEFKSTGVNEFGANTGLLTLYENGKAAIVSRAFSGGLRSPAASAPIPPETYHINLAIRGVADSDRQVVPVGSLHKLHNWYGIERIVIPGAQVEWGHYRVSLNPPRAGMGQGYLGNFIHGKLRPDDYTHGCICERSEVILARLWSLPAQTISVRVLR
jgi:hypothetical protein